MYNLNLGRESKKPRFEVKNLNVYRSFQQKKITQNKINYNNIIFYDVLH